MRVNWLAILIAAIADWLLGAVWFQIFASQWKAGSSPLPPMQTGMTHPNFWPYLVSLVASLVIAYSIARVVAGSETHGLFRGIIAGILIGLAIAAAMVTEMVFEVRPGSFIVVSAGYPLVGSILMGIIIGVWPRKAAPDVQHPATTKP